MSRYQSVMCDRPNCGKIKREANHWLKGAAIHGGYILADAESFDPPKLNGQYLIVDDFCVRAVRPRCPGHSSASGKLKTAAAPPVG